MRRRAGAPSLMRDVMRPNRTASANAAFIVVLAIVATFSAYGAVRLSKLDGLEPSQLLNILGILADLVGAVCLLEIVLKSDRLKGFLVTWVAGGLLWGIPVACLGAAIGGWLFSHHDAGVALGTFFFRFFIWSVLPLSVLESTVFFPQVALFQDLTVRARIFGAFLIISGLVIQLLAAVLDLYAQPPVA